MIYFSFKTDQRRWGLSSLQDKGFFMISTLKMMVRQIDFAQSSWFVCDKVHIFCEGHKILRNLPLSFDWHYLHKTKVRGIFRKILWPSQNLWTLKDKMVFVPMQDRKGVLSLCYVWLNIWKSRCAKYKLKC